jgi:cysteine desulfurase
MERIYLDYNASTPLAPEVVEAMQAYLTEHYGNPSSTHWAGAPAKAAVDKARTQIAELLGCDTEEIIFTSGGSESNNHALKGVFYALKEKGNHIITTRIEHPAIVNPCRFLEELGARVTYVECDAYGQVSPESIEQAITSETILISIMHANNEVGTVQPLADIAGIAKKHGILLHTDAAQSVGKIPTKVDQLGVDMLTIAGHKLYAPKGVGALYVRKGTPLKPLIHGAGHEDGRRAGTENVLLVVGLGQACELASSTLSSSENTIQTLRDEFWDELKSLFGDQIVLNGHPEQRLPNTLSVSLIQRQGQELMARIPEIAASTGSACHSGLIKLSAVLEAMGVEERIGMGTIRFSLGRFTTKEHIAQAVRLIQERWTQG